MLGHTKKDMCQLAYKLAEINNKKHNFSHEDKSANHDYLSGFLKCHPDLALRKLEATSAVRAIEFDRTAVMKFFELKRVGEASRSTGFNRAWEVGYNGGIVLCEDA
ncbi:hypothetical protein PR048_003788 [Dryococelus australis]|uniref:Uncharacterized protein n=1 Tax=Dryococelus australis TaxID=614101 RepID=A0ABQ9IP09_9NEOP|nr:hypothetical protein PR048_003788 [Dryococelus australis]